MKKYQIFPKKIYKDIVFQKAALEDIAALIEINLDEGQMFYKLIDDGIELIASEEKMDKLIKICKLDEVCIIYEEDVEEQ